MSRNYVLIMDVQVGLPLTDSIFNFFGIFDAEQVYK